MIPGVGRRRRHNSAQRAAAKGQREPQVMWIRSYIYGGHRAVASPGQSFVLEPHVIDERFELFPDFDMHIPISLEQHDDGQSPAPGSDLPAPLAEQSLRGSEGRGRRRSTARRVTSSQAGVIRQQRIYD